MTCACCGRPADPTDLRLPACVSCAKKIHRWAKAPLPSWWGRFGLKWEGIA